MNLKMNQNSIFAVLLRSPWWVSGGIAGALFSGVRIILPEEFSLYAFFVSLPFLVIAVHTGWKAMRAPSEAAVARKLASLGNMSWVDFSAAVEAAFRRDGYVVTRSNAPGADFALAKGGKTGLAACKRWKVARTGVEPLRELDAAREATAAQEGFYIATGEITDTARAFAGSRNIVLLSGTELATFLR